MSDPTIPLADRTASLVAAPPVRMVDERRAPGLTRHAWAVLFVLCGAIFLEGADVAMMGVALPSIRADLGMSTAELQWVVSAYVLGYGGFVLLGGRAADLLGRRRMFVGWLAVFIACSALGGLATEGWMLIAARFLTGVAAGFMAPAGLSIVTTTFPEGEARNKALVVYGAVGAGGFTLGLVVGGLLTAIGWRWVFFAPVLAALMILVAARRLLPAAAPAARPPGGFDVAGAVTVTGAMLLAVFAVVRAPDVTGPATLAAAAGAVALGAAFVVVERRAAAPLLRLRVVASGPLVRANLAAMLFISSFVAFQFVAVLYLQELRGWSALETGLALLVAGIDMFLAPTLTPRLVRRFGTRPVIAAGIALAAVGYGLFLPVGPDWPYLAMLPTLTLLGLAFSLAYGALAIAATDGVADEDQGVASGLLGMSIQFGAAVGLAVVAAVNTAATPAARSPQDLLDGYHAALLVPLVAAMLGVAVVSLGRPPQAYLTVFTGKIGFADSQQGAVVRGYDRRAFTTHERMG